MKEHELNEFMARCQQAHKYGFTIAHAADYAARLEKIAGPVATDARKHSPAHLLELAKKAVRVQAGEPAEVAAAPVQETKPKKGKKKAEAEEAPEPELAPEAASDDPPPEA
jgi:hypothetical protein